MRYLLTPITLIIWFLLTYLSLAVVSMGTMTIVLLNWFWTMILGSLVIMMIYFLAKGLKILVEKLFGTFYKNKWIVSILHSLFALLALFGFIGRYWIEPYEMIDGSEGSEYLFIQVWELGILNSLFGIPIIVLTVLYISWVMIAGPIKLKIDD